MRRDVNVNGLGTVGAFLDRRGFGMPPASVPTCRLGTFSLSVAADELDARREEAAAVAALLLLLLPNRLVVEGRLDDEVEEWYDTPRPLLLLLNRRLLVAGRPFE